MRQLTQLQLIIQSLSNRIIKAQKPIRMLDAIKWGADIQREFFAQGCKKPPPIQQDYYQRYPLPFNVADLQQEFKFIEQDILGQLGATHHASRLMLRMCREYVDVIRMLDARGTAEFSLISQNLFGKSTDRFYAGGPQLVELGRMLDESLRNIDESAFLEKEEKNISTADAVQWLQTQLDKVFADPQNHVRVMESDGIIADAAAGSDYIKLRKNALFNMRDLRGLEAHEGWVHVGTTLNGHTQKICTFLSKGTPTDTITQEGLAVFIEIISFNSHPSRLRRIADRIRAIHIAEQGAGFMDVFNLLRGEGRSSEEAFAVAVRVFRGSTPDGPPFSKDLVYSKGFVLVYNFIRLAVRRGRLDLIHLLFCGKLAVQDMGMIYQLKQAGLVQPAQYLPPPVEDLSALTAWMAFSNFLNRLDLVQIKSDFESILQLPNEPGSDRPARD